MCYFESFLKNRRLLRWHASLIEKNNFQETMRVHVVCKLFCIQSSPTAAFLKSWMVILWLRCGGPSLSILRCNLNTLKVARFYFFVFSGLFGFVLLAFYWILGVFLPCFDEVFIVAFQFKYLSWHGKYEM